MYKNLNKSPKDLMSKSSQILRLNFQDRYSVKRGSFSELTEKDIAHFESILDKNRVLTGDDANGYNIDWMRSVRGYSNVALRPKNTGEVSEILKYCNSRKLAVCPQVWGIEI